MGAIFRLHSCREANEQKRLKTTGLDIAAIKFVDGLKGLISPCAVYVNSAVLCFFLVKIHILCDL